MLTSIILALSSNPSYMCSCISLTRVAFIYRAMPERVKMCLFYQSCDIDQ